MNTIARRNALKETDVQHSAGANEHQSAEQPPEKLRAAGEAPAAKIRVFRVRLGTPDALSRQSALALPDKPSIAVLA